MQNNRFVVLTGHLSNYPLSDLIGILRHQTKTGRLLIEYPKGPAMFFFQNGELIDARMNDLVGLQAICVALAQPEAAFNFNPLIPPSRRSIEPSLQRAVSELFGCWDETALQIETTAEAASLDAAPVDRNSALQGRRSEPLALPPAPPSHLKQRAMLLVAAGVLVGVGLSTVIAVTGGFSANRPSPTIETSHINPQNPLPPVLPVEVSRPIKTNRRPILAKTVNTDKTDKKEQSQQSVKVVMQIENGRVLKASIANPKPGMDSYEALALRIARQRRYPASTSGGQTVTISVSKPE